MKIDQTDMIDKYTKWKTDPTMNLLFDGILLFYFY